MSSTIISEDIYIHSKNKQSRSSGYDCHAVEYRASQCCLWDAVTLVMETAYAFSYQPIHHQKNDFNGCWTGVAGQNNALSVTCHLNAGYCCLHLAMESCRKEYTVCGGSKLRLSSTLSPFHASLNSRLPQSASSRRFGLSFISLPETSPLGLAPNLAVFCLYFPFSFLLFFFSQARFRRFSVLV